MPRSLTFQLGNSQFDCPLIKIDRSKVYGSVQVVTTDHENAEAELLSLARDGRTLIPLGGTGSGYVNKSGFWVETGERTPVDVEGDPMELVESSFSAPISLTQKVDEDVLLDHPVRLAYNLGMISNKWLSVLRRRPMRSKMTVKTIISTSTCCRETERCQTSI